MLAALVVLDGVGTARAARFLEPRAILRCETMIEREGIYYTNKIIWSVPRCLRALIECEMRNEAPCADAVRACPGAIDDVTAAEERLIDRVSKSCESVALDKLLTALAFRDGMASCAPTTHKAFATCLAATLRAKAGQTFSRLMPAGCAYIAAGGVADILPPEICAATD